MSVDKLFVATYFICFASSNRVKLGEDHSQYKWIDPKTYQDYNLVAGLPEVF